MPNVTVTCSDVGKNNWRKEWNRKFCALMGKHGADNSAIAA